jgi:hypothetical protein
MKLGDDMKHELQNKLHINFIQTTLLTGLMGVITGPLQSLILTAVRDKTGKFLKEQFKKHATSILRQWIITQLRGKFVEYLSDFIVTYIEANIEKILDNRLASGIAGKIVNNIVSGLGTYLLR